MARTSEEDTCGASVHALNPTVLVQIQTVILITWEEAPIPGLRSLFVGYVDFILHPKGDLRHKKIGAAIVHRFPVASGTPDWRRISF